MMRGKVQLKGKIKKARLVAKKFTERKDERKNRAYNTCGSQVVTHPSTEQAQHCLTSVIR